MKAIEVDNFSPTKQLIAENQLFADGGVIGKNPSSIGGTFAFSILNKGVVMQNGGSIIVPTKDNPSISNNFSEFVALLEGMERLPNTWTGIVYSDSKITLGRFFCGWSLTNIPNDLIRRLAVVRTRMVDFRLISYCLLEGHPTKSDLIRGYGKRGYPVHEQNVWCDKKCQSLTRAYKYGETTYGS